MSALGDIASGIGNIFRKDDGGINWGNIITIGGGIASALDNTDQQKVGYQGGIPAYTATRQVVPGTNDPARRPGSGGRRYFTDTQYSKSGLLPGYPTATELAAINAANNTAKRNNLADLVTLLNGGARTPALGPAAPTTTTPPPATGGITTVPSSPNTPAPTTQTPATTPAAPQNNDPPDIPYVSGSTQLDLSTPNKGYANPYEPKRYDDSDTKEEALGLARTFMADKNIDAGEASTLFGAAWHGGVSPSEMAGALGIPESQVVNWLYNNLKDYGSHQYLSKYGYAQGGIAGVPRYLQGKTDGMADELPAKINGTEEAALSHGEFVVPADVISALGNGNSDAGAEQLYAMMDRVRQAAHGTKKQMNKINPQQVLPV